MTVTIDLPRNWEAFDALPDVFFWPVPTVGVWYYGESKDDDVYGAGPDPEWVKAGEPCLVCGGRGIRFVDRFCQVYGNRLADELNLTLTIPCPDCLDGKPRIAITVPCECACHRGIMARTTAHHDCPCSVEMIAPSGYEQPGETPDVHVRVNSHRVTVGQAVIEHGPLPVVDALDPSVLDQCYPLLRTSTSVDDGIVFESGPEPEDGFIIDHPDPASLVGTWGVICRKVQP